tara:strand:+ start:134 stop:280 length:147 start_codon:yes stop_codon:yes gene_type:complete
MKNKPHKHAKFIKAWALGHEIERLINDDWISAGSKLTHQDGIQTENIV